MCEILSERWFKCYDDVEMCSLARMLRVITVHLWGVKVVLCEKKKTIDGIFSSLCAGFRLIFDVRLPSDELNDRLFCCSFDATTSSIVDRRPSRWCPVEATNEAIRRLSSSFSGEEMMMNTRRRFMHIIVPFMRKIWFRAILIHVYE